MAIKKKEVLKIAKPAPANASAGKKPVWKTVVKKVAKKLAKPATTKPKLKLGKPATRKAPAGKPIGVVTHFFDHISVGIVKFSKPVKVGTTVRFLGAHTDLVQPIVSMQYDHEPIAVAKKGTEVGIKVKEKVHEGNKVYLAEK